MALSSVNRRWIQLNNFRADLIDAKCISAINNHEFIIATSFNDRDDNNGIHKYHINKDEWTHITRYPTNGTYVIQKNKMY